MQHEFVYFREQVQAWLDHRLEPPALFLNTRLNILGWQRLREETGAVFPGTSLSPRARSCVLVRVSSRLAMCHAEGRGGSAGEAAPLSTGRVYGLVHGYGGHL